MLTWIKTRAAQGYRTLGYPDQPQEMPGTFYGRPMISAGNCPEGCTECVDSCPTFAIRTDSGVSLDLGRCVFCAECVKACPNEIVKLSSDFRMGGSTRESLVIRNDEAPMIHKLNDRMLEIFGRSMRFRHVSAGDCGGCKDELNALSNIVFDLSRFGMNVVASPRHADALLVSGPIPENMRVALEKAYLALPEPRIVIAIGACAISGGPFVDSPYCHNGVESILPVDMYIPGCPPHPLTVLDAILRLLDRLPKAQWPKVHDPSLNSNPGNSFDKQSTKE
ncbi:MAG: NADH-quinone oxidoreductase subunit NuoB [Planctomycetota bacterium]|nr:NADH-quinone oxidoreductase subunit NuoB [Planctomycetota bacterium]